MTEVTRILNRIEDGDPSAADQLLPLVYEELRKLASQRLGQEKPGQTLQATALVHEVYLRLTGGSGDEQNWNSRGHFFGAAANAMRRLLVERARRKCSLKHGGKLKRQEFPLEDVAEPDLPEQLLAIHEALKRLAVENPKVAQLVELRYFAGLSAEESAAAMEVSTRTALRYWTYAKAWLLEELRNSTEA